MKRLSIGLLGAAAAAALVSATPAFAADAIMAEPVAERFSGNVAIWGQYVSPSGWGRSGVFEDDDFSASCGDGMFCGDAWGMGSDARAHYSFGNGHALQFENLIDYHGNLRDDETRPDEGTLHAALGGHYIYRSGDLALGAFVGASVTSHIDDEERSVHGFGGGEAAYFIGNATLFGQLGYAGRLAGDDYVDDLWFGRLGARYFFAPGSRLEGSVAYGISDHAQFTTDPDERGDLDWLQLAVNYEQQIGASPISGFVGYQGDYVEVTTGLVQEEVWAHTFKVGLRMSFGGSLQEEDRSGARTFDFTNLRAPLSYSDELHF